MDAESEIQQLDAQIAQLRSKQAAIVARQCDVMVTREKAAALAMLYGKKIVDVGLDGFCALDELILDDATRIIADGHMSVYVPGDDTPEGGK